MTPTPIPLPLWEVRAVRTQLAHESRLLRYLRQHPGQWFLPRDLEPVGGREVTRRLRQLRADGHPIQSERVPETPGLYRYRYAP